MKMFGWSKATLVIVTAFIILNTCALSAEKANAAPYIELGHSVAGITQTVFGAGYRTKRYGFAIEATGQGVNDYGLHVGVKPIVGVYRVADPRWCLYGHCLKTALGAAYSPSQELVGDINYRLGVMIESDSGYSIFVRHYSSAGLFRVNEGLNSAGIRIIF